MKRTQILLSTVSIFAMASPIQAQWAIETRDRNKTAWAVGVEGLMQLAVSCIEEDPLVVLTLHGAAEVRSAEVEAVWDDGSIEHLTWGEQDGILHTSAASPSARAFVTKLRQRNAIRLRVRGARDRPATDLLDLTGSFRAIGSLSCGTSVSTESSRRSRHTVTEIKDLLIRQSITAYSGNCPCPYNRDNAGRRCGRRSAYSRPGGATPLCFPSDVRDAAVAAYRRSTELGPSR